MGTGIEGRRSSLRAVDAATLSGIPLRAVYDSLPGGFSAEHDLGRPGEFPYTRGIHPQMYRARLWTMRQFSGFATAEETNQRYHYLLQQGQTGLSVAFDLPTLMGFDSDSPHALGEVGKCGVAISSLEDMETLFRGIDLAAVSVSMTINSPAAILYAMYLAVARQQGVQWTQLRGTLQNDILKEYIAQKEFIYPPEPSMRLAVDVMEFSLRHTPQYNPVSISGYHIREAGSTAVQELAFTLRDGIEYIEWLCRRGLAVDDFAGRLSFFFNAHNDLFEEVAKYRAARRMWARMLTGRFGARLPRSLLLRFHTQTAGCSLTWQQPYNNIIRTTLQALAAVLGGTQSLHTNSLDEAYALPSEQAVTLALRTQQILAEESGVTATADPLGGSFFIENLTHEVEAAAHRYIAAIDAMGGMIPAIERGYPQREIAEASYAYQRSIETGERKIVGVNCYQAASERPLEILRIDQTAASRQRHRLATLRSRRSQARVARALDSLRREATAQTNLMPCILEAVEAYATVGEICDALRSVWGDYVEKSII